MIRRVIFALGALAAASIATTPSNAQQPAATESAAVPAPETTGSSPVATPSATVPMALEAAALRNALSTLPAGNTEEERNEHAALLSFYEARAYALVWLTEAGTPTPKAAAAISEIKRADEWGLEAKDFSLPGGLEKRAEGTQAAPEAIAADELKISQAVLKYGRYARGGRIINPSEQLSSYLDRKPQLTKPEAILDGISAADQPDAYLRGLNPQHPQFDKLRQKYLSLSNAHNERSADAKKVLANMEEWRWMPADMGGIYVWNNIPEYTQRVIKDGKPIREARIVAGEVDKQTPIFSRPLRKVTFKPTWIVPDSVKVHELLPDLLNGGRMMREYGLEVSREGRPVNWHRVDWSSADIRAYDVTQPYQAMSVMGKFKFSFPNQHTVFMHDALPREKWMFRKAQRTYSHGCMRVGNPIELAEIILREDQGWDAERVEDAVSNGPLNNEVALERKIPVHITYFTAIVDENGKLHTFPDVYGHERRITQALEGKWDRIAKGRNHLAPVELTSAHSRHYARDETGARNEWQRRSPYGRTGYFEPLFGGDD
jgi:L,D-transpeptidase YcbB